MLKPPTKEQKEILKALEKSNISVDAVAGSGKTTTILHVANTFKDKQICCITYNTKLKNETNLKKLDLDLNNLKVFTYHGSCNTYYLQSCGELIDDLKLKSVVTDGLDTLKPISYDIIIVDEVQDMNSIYAKYIKKFINDNCKSNKIIILGDKNQCINQYNDANHRFLTLGSEIFKNEYPWVSLKLTETFRVPYEICEFLNKVLLKEERMISNKVSGHKPRYLITNAFAAENGCMFLVNEIKYYLGLKDEYGNILYKPDDIFVLSISVKKKYDNKSPSNILANMLSNMGILVHVTNEEGGTPDEKLLKNKIVFSTYNSVKGLERKVVIALNFDIGFFEYFDKDANPFVCPNKLYVGVTRSLERLTLIHHYESGYLPFLKGVDDIEKEKYIELYCDINPTDGGGNSFRMRKKINKSIKPNVHIVTDMVKHLKIDVIEDILPLFNIIEVRQVNDKIEIDVISEQSPIHWENVSDITGTAIPMYYAIKVFNKDINETMTKLNGDKDHVNILRIANSTNCKVSNSYYKMNQIKKYNWLSPLQLSACIERVQSLCNENIINIEGDFEKRIECTTTVLDTYQFSLIGQVDYIDDKCVVEFKCVKNIEREHMVQLLLYKFINETNGVYIDNYYLYNVLDDQLLSLHCDYNNLTELIIRLIKTKFMDKDNIDSDLEFRKFMIREGLIID
uniref:Uncharacterized protein n=1 Tax=viral metagenome TaxID=1070528 RepID=A0A6C0CG19_9ZZZZ